VQRTVESGYGAFHAPYNYNYGANSSKAAAKAP
jgi:hypothetical protein